MYLNVILYSIKLSWSWSCFAIAWPLTNPQDVVWAAISTFSSCQGASNVDVYPFHGYWVLRQRLWFNPCAHRHWRHCLCLVSHQLSSYQSWRISYHSAFVLTFFHSSSASAIFHSLTCHIDPGKRLAYCSEFYFLNPFRSFFLLIGQYPFMDLNWDGNYSPLCTWRSLSCLDKRMTFWQIEVPL